MRRNWSKRLSGLGVIACALAGVGSAAATPMVGLTTGNQLIGFDSASPSNITGRVSISGLQAGESILGIDQRPATGDLYALGSSGRLYVLNLTNGGALQVGTGTFAVPLNGTAFGVDFNPTVDRIRVVSNTGQNLRLHPDTGAVVDGDAVTAGVQGDGNLNGAATGADGAAYTNNFAGAGSTTLYDISSATDTLYTQGNATTLPNLGTLFTVGPLGVDTSSVLGFEITATGEALAALNVGGTSRLYSINLTTGAATQIGALNNAVQGISIGNAGAVGNIVVPANSTTGLALLFAVLAIAATLALRRQSA